MSEIDIRNNEVQSIQSIRFDNDRHTDGTRQACRIMNRSHEGVELTEGPEDPDYIIVFTAEQAGRLIAGLEKAIEMGWLK